MNRKKQKKPKVPSIKNECINISQEQMIEIQAEAYYRALKRIEYEKANAKESMREKKNSKWYNKLFFMLGVVIWPWKVRKQAAVNSEVYDSILVMFTSGALHIIGAVMWFFGIIASIFEMYKIITIGISSVFVVFFLLGLVSLFLGDIFIMAGDEFSKEKDSNKIYAYSASIIALVSCGVGIIALFRM